MARTGHFTAVALLVLLAGCRSETRIVLFEPPLGSEPTDVPAMDGGSAGSEAGPPRPTAGTGAQAGSSGRRSGSGSAGRSGASGSAGAAGTSRPPRVEDAGPPRTADDPIPGLILHYDFSGEGTTVRDLVGDADATLVGGAELSPDRDYVELDGADDYVDMPNGIVSSLESATFIAWIAWNGGPCWQRVFDFGSNEGGEDASGTVRTSLFMTPVACGSGRAVFAVMAEFERIQYQMFAAQPLVAGYTIQVALVVDGDRNTFRMYNDGVVVAAAETPFRLSDFVDNNNWLGRSQWPQDRYLGAIYGDFRIYDRALDPDEMATLYARGPSGL